MTEAGGRVEVRRSVPRERGGRRCSDVDVAATACRALCRVSSALSRGVCESGGCWWL